MLLARCQDKAREKNGEIWNPDLFNFVQNRFGGGKLSGKNLVVYIVYLYCIFADTFFHLLLKVFSITRHVTQVEQVDV